MLITLLGSLAANVFGATVDLPPLFSDNMVLQCDRPLRFWGAAEAGQKITVEFAGKHKTVRASRRGEWRLDLGALPPSAEPRTLRIGSRQFTNVVVGEVWLAAGQSNMEFPLAREASAAQEIPTATNSLLRLLNFSFAGQYLYAKPFGSNEVTRQTPGKFFGGAWKPCAPDSAKDFSAVAFYFGKELSQELSVPVGVINCAVGGSPTEAWIRRAALESDPELRAMVSGNWLTNGVLDDWCRRRGHENLDAVLQTGFPAPGDDLGPNHYFKPAFLWEAGPARFAPFALRGVLWYQGESNSLEERRVRQHEELFPLLVRDWRAAWAEELPFLFCQLSSIRTNHYQSACWPEFRDQQRRFLDTIPNTGMAVTSDRGALDDVHPRDKRDVGHCLALWALAKTYGKGIECSGPVPESVRRDGAKVTVKFGHATGLKTSDGQAVRGFQIAGGAGIFHAVPVSLSEDRVVLATDQVSQPVIVRYAWQPFTDANLVNAAGLPASTFEIKITH